MAYNFKNNSIYKANGKSDLFTLAIIKLALLSLKFAFAIVIFFAIGLFLLL